MGKARIAAGRVEGGRRSDERGSTSGREDHGAPDQMPKAEQQDQEAENGETGAEHRKRTFSSAGQNFLAVAAFYEDGEDAA